MPVDAKRDRALGLITQLRKLAEHPNTPKPEAEAARGRIEALRKKHNITTSEPAPKPQTKQTWTRTDQDEFLRRYQEAAKKAAAEDEWRRRAMAQRDREAKERAAEAKRRKEAQDRYAERMRDKDSMGRPLTEAEKAEARRDPLGWAAKQDKRTHTQKQEDLNSNWGSSDGYRYTKPSGYKFSKPKVGYLDQVPGPDQERHGATVEGRK